MKILVIGGTGVIGNAIVELLRKEHEVISIGKTRGDYQVDIEDKASIEKMYEDFKDIDGIISTAGTATYAPFQEQTDEDLDSVLNNKIKGQVNLIRLGMNHIKDNGFIILTTGAASHTPMPGGASLSLACAGIEGYVKVVDIEKQNNIRINVVRPALVTESMEIWGIYAPNSVSAADTAKVYQKVMELEESAIMVDVPECLATIKN